MIDWTKPIQTDDGRPAILIDTDNYGDSRTRVVKFLSKTSPPFYVLTTVPESGVQSEKQIIMNVPKKTTLWYNFYDNGVSNGYKTKDEADLYAEVPRVACKSITFTDGEGLED